MVTKKFLSVFALVFLSTALLAACKGNNNNVIIPPGAAPEATLLATGGTSTSGTGGAGGSVYAESYGGAVKVLKSGTVDAVISVPTYTPDFGADPTAHAVVSTGTTTTVVVDADDFSGELCMATSLGSPSLFIGDGSGTCGDTNDVLVTGLTVETGATLILADYGYWGGGYGELWLDNDLVVNGTIRTDASSGLYIEASTIDVESSGEIVTSATTTDSNAGELYLGYGNGMTKQIINQGTIAAKGLGNGSGGYVYLEPDDLVMNTGTIDASGGDSTVDGSGGGPGGVSGELDVYVDYGDFYSSGIIRVNGGKGATEGGDNNADYCNWTDQWGNNCNSVYIETALYDNANRNGDIFISGTWEANGGDGLGSDGLNGRGGYGGYIVLQTDALGTVTINANMSAKGGDGTAATNSSSGAYTYGIDIYQDFDPYGYGFTLPATAGKISIAGKYDLRGGSGDQIGGDAGYLEVYGNNYGQDVPGADVELVGFPAMDLNGGEGANGGSASSNAFRLYTSSAGGTPGGRITNEASIEAMGGKANNALGTGGNGGNIDMSSATPPTLYPGPMSVAGGTGTTPGLPGTITIDGNPI